MEILEPLPEQVTDDLFAQQDAKSTPTGIERLLSDPDTVKEIASAAIWGHSVFKQLVWSPVAKNDYADWSNIADATTNAALSTFYGASPAPKSTMASQDYLSMSPALQRLVDSIDYHIMEAIPEQWRSAGVGSFRQSIQTEIIRLVTWKMSNFVVPLSIDHKGKEWGDIGLASDQAKKAFPEAEGIINAMRYLAKDEKFVPRDVHSENVMMRPSTGEMVIVDLGLFEKRLFEALSTPGPLLSSRSYLLAMKVMR
jgi:hypothetical protein